MTPKVFDTVHGSLWSDADADHLAAKLTAEDEDGWCYSVDRSAKRPGLSRITITDELENLVGYL